MEHSLADQAKPIDVPTHVLASDDDPVIPMQAIENDVVGLIPDANLTRVNGIGHLMPLENERLVADGIEGL